MRIIVKVKPNSKKVSVLKVTETQLPFMKDEQDIYMVYVKEPPVNGMANEGVINALAEYFEISKSQVVLLKGGSSKNKIFEIIK